MPAVSVNILRHGKERKERGCDRSLASIVASRFRHVSVTWSLNNYADVWAQRVCSFCLAEQKQNIIRGGWIRKGRSSFKWKGCIPKNLSRMSKKLFGETIGTWRQPIAPKLLMERHLYKLSPYRLEWDLWFLDHALWMKENSNERGEN